MRIRGPEPMTEEQAVKHRADCKRVKERDIASLMAMKEFVATLPEFPGMEISELGEVEWNYNFVCRVNVGMSVEGIKTLISDAMEYL